MKKTWYLTLCALAVIFCLFACTEEEPDDSKTNEVTENTQAEFTLVYTDDESYLLAQDAAPILGSLLNLNVSFANASAIPEKNAIIIGEAETVASKKAYRYMEEVEEVGELSSRYSVYSDGSRLAITYDDEAGFEAAISRIVELLDAEEILNPKAGLIDSGCITYRERAEKARAERREEILAEVEYTHNKATADALRSLFNLFDDEIIAWLANLWDPVIGGFYYSNSARNNVGFLPDIESTAQALGFLSNYGFVDEYGGNWADAIPESMKLKLLVFAQSLQDPDDGYFYHPQWTKESTTASRRGRDNGWALSIITKLGGEPLYDNATTYDGEPDLVSYGKLTNKLGGSLAAAVSKVIPTAESLLPSYLQTPDNMENYMRSLNIKEDSYYAGNVLAAQWRDIQAAGTAVIKRMFEVFADLQSPETGMWEDTLSYNATNGLMKISSLYEHFNEPIPHADVAVKGLIEILKDPEGAEHVCSVYNPWVTLTTLFNTLNTVESEKIRATLIADAPALIKVTMEKLLPSLVESGGFSYYHDRTSSTSQGMLVAIPNTKEADVNATTVACGTLRTMAKVLKLGDMKIYTDEDYDYFIQTIGDLGEIIKNEEIIPEAITFDYGYVPNGIANNIGKGSASFINFEVVEDPLPSEPEDGEDYDMALRIDTLKYDDSYADVSSKTEVGIMNPMAVGYCYAFETDFMYESTDATSNTMTQLFFQGSKVSFALAFNAYTVGSEQRIRIVEHSASSTDRKDVLATGLKFGEWIHFRAEFYKNENKAIIYINGSPVSIADLYYTDSEEASITKCSLLHYRSVASRLYLDNVVCEKLDKEFVSFGSSGEDVNFGTDDGSAVEKGPTTYEENCPSADNVKIIKNSPALNTFITFDKVTDQTAAKKGEGNNALRIETFAGYTDLNVSYIDVLNPEYSAEALGFDKSYTFEADMYFDPSTEVGWSNQMFFYTGATCSYSISFRIVDMGYAGKCVRITRNSTSDRTAIIEDGIIKVGEWFNLKIVFYKGSESDGSMTAARYFVNGEYSAQDLTYRAAALTDTAPIEFARFTFYSREAKTLLYLDNVSFTENAELLPEEPQLDTAVGDGIVDFEDGDPDFNLATAYTTEEISSADLFRYTIVTDPTNEVNKVLCAQVYSSNYSGITNGVNSVATLQYTRPDSTANEENVLNSSYVYGVDYYISSVMPNTAEADQSAPEGEMFSICIIQGGNHVYNYSFKFEMVNGKLCVSYGNSSSKVTILTTEIGYNEWFNVNLEFFKNNGVDDETTDASDGAAYRITVTAANGTKYVGTVATSSLDSRATSSVRVMKIYTTFFATSVKKTVYIDNVSVVKKVGVTDYTITKTSAVESADDTTGDGEQSGNEEETTEVSDNLVTFEDGDADSVTNTTSVTDGSFKFDTLASDPTGAVNKCLKATVWANAYNNATSQSTTVVTNGDYNSGDTMQGNAFRFAADVYVSSVRPNDTVASAPTGIPFQFSFSNGQGSGISTYTIYLDNNDDTTKGPILRIRQNYTGENSTKNYVLSTRGADGGGITFDEWFNISFTLYVGSYNETTETVTGTGVLITVTASDGTQYSAFDDDICLSANYMHYMFGTETSNATANAKSSNLAIKTACVTWYKTSTHRDVYLDNLICETLTGETYAPAE